MYIILSGLIILDQKGQDNKNDNFLKMNINFIYKKGYKSLST